MMIIILPLAFPEVVVFLVGGGPLPTRKERRYHRKEIKSMIMFGPEHRAGGTLSDDLATVDIPPVHSRMV